MHRSKAICVAALLATSLSVPAAIVAGPVTPTTGVDMSYVDSAVKPGDDFDDYANGAWRARTEIPADASATGVTREVFLRGEQNNAAIIQAALTANARPGTDTRRIADWYRAYTDTKGIEARGIAPLKPQLAAIAAIKDKKALSAMLGGTVRADTDALNSGIIQTENLFGLWVTQGLETPDVTMPYVFQGGLGLPDRDYYLSDEPETAKIRNAYRAYVARLLGLAGFGDADARAGRIVALETRIAKVHADGVTNQDAHKGDNPWTRADFAAKAPGIDWNGFWTAAGLPRQQRFIVWEPGAVTGEAALIASEPLETWKDWLAFHRINTVTEVLPAAFDDLHFDFYGKTLYGTPQQRPRDKLAIASVNAWLGDAMGQLYVKHYFSAAAKADIQAMVKNILAAFDRRVAALDWMTPATKAEARRKIATMRVGVGYPETWRSYASLVVKADDPLGNLQRAQLLEYRHQLAKIGKPVDRGEWWMTPQTVNAVNLPLQNALNFPAAILQAPYYDPNADAAANYGSIGSVIGHEISHSFDNSGADFDAEGKLRNWWTPEDLAHFEAAGAALAAQYDGYEVLPGLHINGKLTLGENIADVAGLVAAYEAYHDSLGGKEAPVIGGLTGDQRFFIAFAQGWRQKAREKRLRTVVATNGHAPDRWRVLTVRNLDGWYPAFKVQPGDKLYLPPDQRVKIW